MGDKSRPILRRAAEASRDEDNQTRKQRLADVAKGPGVFVYDGSAVDTIATPTPKLSDGRRPVFNEHGMPVMDRANRQVFEPSGVPLRDADGTPVMGGAPKIERVPIDVRNVWGVSFPKGEEVQVDDPRLARKLRCLPEFGEVVGYEDAPADAPKKRGRPKKDDGNQAEGAAAAE